VAKNEKAPQHPNLRDSCGCVACLIGPGGGLRTLRSLRSSLCCILPRPGAALCYLLSSGLSAGSAGSRAGIARGFRIGVGVVYL